MRIGNICPNESSNKRKTRIKKLWKGISDKVIDVIGSDHAPHTIEEKEKIIQIHRQE